MIALTTIAIHQCFYNYCQLPFIHYYLPNKFYSFIIAVTTIAIHSLLLSQLLPFSISLTTIAIHSLLLSHFPKRQLPKGLVRPPAGAVDCNGGRALQLGLPSLASADLGICSFGNCTFGKLPFEKLPLGSCHMGKVLY